MTQFAQRLARLVGDSQIEKIILEVRTRKIFCRKVCDSPRIASGIVFNALNYSLKEPVTNCQGQSKVKVVSTGETARLTDPVTKIFEKCRLDVASAKACSNCLG